MSRKPRIFIGSSVESKPIANAVNINLDHSAEVTIWTNGTFDLTNNSIDSLVDKANSVDFAIFIFSPDDLAIIRKEEKKVVRDNVIFELGLFIGTLGKRRCYIVKPRNVDLHFPTDLLGVTTTDFEPNRSDGDVASALNYACSKIKEAIEKEGLISNANTSTILKVSDYSGCINLNEVDIDILNALLAINSYGPEGAGLWNIQNEVSSHKTKLAMSLIKLERAGYLEKANAQDRNGEAYYTYCITQNGIDELLRIEEEVQSLPDNGRILVPDDDLPF